MMVGKSRADIALYSKGLSDSREKAQALIMAGLVYSNGRKVEKPSTILSTDDDIVVKEPVHPYASRGGCKLEKALRVFNIKVTGHIVMDIGAAAGGFTDVLLCNGAKHVYAIDVGYGQLNWRIRNDPRVTVMERLNARYLKPCHLPQKPNITVMDVSFISVRLIIPVAAALMEEDGAFIVLIKPQFEVGKDKVPKSGVIRDRSIHKDAILSITNFFNQIGWYIHGLDYSPITGPKGNIEFLAWAKKEPCANVLASQESIQSLVDKAHSQLLKA